MDAYTRVIEVYGHNGRVGVLVEFCLRSGFTARLPEFSALARDIAVHIAAENPASVEALLDQRFVKSPEKSVGSLLAASAKILGEAVSVARFVRWDNEEHTAEEPDPPLRTAAAMRRRA
jgi:elongation factor Ts